MKKLFFAIRPAHSRLALFALTALLWTINPTTAPSQNEQRSEQRGIFGAGQPGEVSVVRMEARKLGLKDFKMDSRQINGRLAIDAFSARLGSGTLQGVGLVDWSRPNDRQRMNITATGVEVMALLEAFKVQLDARIDGVSNAQIDVQWNGVRGTLPRETMDGTVVIQVGPGQIVGADVLRQVSAYTGIPQLQQVQFQSALLRGIIRQGIMSITHAEFTGPHASAKGVGIMDMRTEQIRIRFDGSVSPALLGQSTMPQVRALGVVAGAASDGSFIRIPLPVIMSGQVRDPEFTLRWETTAE